MQRVAPSLVVVAIIAVGGGCEDPKKAVEDVVFEKLVCEEVARPSTLARIRTLLDAPNADNAGAVLLNPQDLASLVSVVGPEAEVGVVLTRNVLELSPQVDDVLKHGWPTPGTKGAGAGDGRAYFDGVACGEPVMLDCTAGSGSVIYDCEVDNGVAVFRAIEVVLDKCVVDGSVYHGAVTLVHEGDDGASARFDALAINETKVVNGDVRLAVGGASGFDATVRTDDGGLTIEDFGGPDAGLECGEELRIDTLAFTDDDDVATVELSGDHRTTEETYGVHTGDGGLRFDGSCACPLPGSGVTIDVPRPLGEEGTVAHAGVSYDVAARDAPIEACAKATVRLSGWPAGCFADADCGRAATESVLGAALTATCIR